MLPGQHLFFHFDIQQLMLQNVWHEFERQYLFRTQPEIDYHKWFHPETLQCIFAQDIVVYRQIEV